MNFAHHQEKPSAEAVKKFTDALEDMLSAHKLSVQIELRDEPFRLVHFRNGEETGTDYLWVERVLISKPEVEDLKVSIFGQGIPEEMQPHEIWQEAYHIQDQLYRNLERSPVLPPSSSNDPYWVLWEKRRHRKE